MAEITASMVRTLREETGQGMMECKKALQEAGGDIEQAKSILRKKGLATMERKAQRETKEGLVAARVSDDRTQGAMVEVLCETDFTARNDVFQQMASDVADLVFAAETEGDVPANDAIQEKVQWAFRQIGENMQYSRGVKIRAAKVAAYIHHNQKVGVLVGVDSADVSDETLNDLCMHIAFSDPMGITTEDIPAEIVEKEREIALAQAEQTGKPREIAEKIVQGKMSKFLASNALMEQPFIKDEKQQVKDLLGGATVTTFRRFAIGG